MTILSTIILLFSNAVTFRRDKSIFFNRSALVIFPYCALVNHELLVASFLLLGLGFFNGLLHITYVSQTFRPFIYFITIGIVHLTAFYPRKMWNMSYDNPITKTFYKILHSNSDLLNKMGEQFKIIEYPLIILFIILGGLFLMSSSDIVSIFLAIELQSYGLYILAAIYKNSELSVSAALVYFLLGGLSSCFILLGTSLVYSNSASTILDGHYIITGISNIAEYSSTKMSSLSDFSYITISLLIMSVGLLFKVSAAPFHFWSPDVYDAIPTIVTTFVAIIAKISILVLLLELVIFTSNLMYNKDFNWSYSLLLSSLMSFVIGTVLGLSQPRIKRLLAYSTISHIAFILLAIAINTIESIEAFIFYTLQYTLSNLCAFVILLSIGFSSYFYRYTSNKEFIVESGNLPERNNSPIQLISELRGYFYINPLMALTFAIVLFSFVGIPPLLGFFAKQMVLSSAINNGYIFLSIIAILTSVISASYYLNVIKEMFFTSTSLIVNENVKDMSGMYAMTSYTRNNTKHIQYTYKNFSISSFLSFIISVLTLLVLLFMLASQEWLRTTRLLSLSLFDT